MAEDSESDDTTSTDSDVASDDDTDDIPGGSIEDFVDDESAIHTDEQAPMGATGTPDPFELEERESVSEAVGAPVSDEELDDEPELDTDDADDSVIESSTDAESESRTGDADTESVVERDDASVTETSGSTDAAPTEPIAEESAVTESSDAVDEGLLGDSPDSDEEMPLTDHIEEMVRRLGVVLIVAGLVALAVFPIADQVINFLWNSHIPGAQTITDRRPRLYGPLELLVTELKVAALAGFVIGLPLAVYETYLFMRPGLFPRERRYYLAAVPTSLILALIGVAFAHFVVLPAIFAYFTSYTTGTAVVAFGLKETFSLILILMGYMALVFQIPLFIMLAIMMNLTTREWMEQRRFLFWGAFLGISFLISPDPTGMAPIIVAATMIGLFEGTLALLRWTGN